MVNMRLKSTSGTNKGPHVLNLIFELILDRLGTVLRPFWDRFRSVLGPFWDRVGIVLDTFSILSLMMLLLLLLISRTLQGSYHPGAWSRARRRRGRRPLQIIENLLGSRSHV